MHSQLEAVDHGSCDYNCLDCHKDTKTRPFLIEFAWQTLDVGPGVTYSLDKERVAALSEMDEAAFSLVHLRVFMVAGAGFFTDAYDTFAISIASLMLGYVYGTSFAYNTLSVNQDLGLKVAAPVGTFVGQLLFGWLADKVGRKRMFQSVDSCGFAGLNNAQMGVGIGGDYPLSAIISSEFSATRNRGRMMSAVFASRGWGNFIAALVAFVIVVASRGRILLGNDVCDPPFVDSMWRLLIGLGCVPGAVALYFRLTIPETPRFTMDVERNVQRAAEDIHNVLTTGKFPHDPDAIVLWQWDNMKVLIGTCYSWFVLDIAFYGLALNSSTILQTVNLNLGIHAESESALAGLYVDLKNICGGNLVLSASLIPGYWASHLVIDSWGRKPIQLMGFSLLAIIFIAMGKLQFDKLIGHTTAKTNAFVFLYCLANFFQNFGPNVTTFVIPGEAFPTRYRSTAHGISAASGKFGAIIAQIVLARLVGNSAPGSKDLNDALEKFLRIFGFIMLTGIPSTLLLPETKGRTLEELSNEDQEGFFKGFAGSSQPELSGNPDAPESLNE
ncbi:major facilitator superfamily domain-containing protein [Infundibulicybe gibba]|nr:major facilitator superfamily domain-containing protein [Infundibulicybe gibba]